MNCSLHALYVSAGKIVTQKIVQYTRQKGIVDLDQNENLVKKISSSHLQFMLLVFSKYKFLLQRS